MIVKKLFTNYFLNYWTEWIQNINKIAYASKNFYKQ